MYPRLPITESPFHLVVSHVVPEPFPFAKLLPNISLSLFERVSLKLPRIDGDAIVGLSPALTVL